MQDIKKTWKQPSTVLKHHTYCTHTSHKKTQKQPSTVTQSLFKELRNNSWKHNIMIDWPLNKDSYYMHIELSIQLQVSNIFSVAGRQLRQSRLSTKRLARCNIFLIKEHWLHILNKTLIWMLLVADFLHAFSPGSTSFNFFCPFSVQHALSVLDSYRGNFSFYLQLNILNDQWHPLVVGESVRKSVGQHLQRSDCTGTDQWIRT